MNACLRTLACTAVLLAATLSCGPATTGQSRGAAGATAALDSPLGVPRSLRGGVASAPLVLDPGDLSMGTTVQFRRVPTLAELDDLRFVRGLAHVVLVLDRWPEEYAPIATLDRLPQEVDLIVVLAGYPSSRGAGQAWNLLRARTRIVIVADGPPPVGMAHDLNAMRGLERLVVDTDDPSMSGFEHLQRPVTFRVVRE